MPDPNFPAKGKVFEESVKPLPGLSGESRSGDANGQWFRVLAAGGTTLAELQPGVFTALPLPIEGANPPKPDARPPLHRSTPCETQEAPNLRTKAGARAAAAQRRHHQRRLPGPLRAGQGRGGQVAAQAARGSRAWTDARGHRPGRRPASSSDRLAP